MTLDFEYKPEVLKRGGYKYDYPAIFRDIALAGPEGSEERRTAEIRAYRTLILTDLFFIVYFVMGLDFANKPFVVQACREIEDGLDDFTVDVWAREHYKSTIITIAETIQYALKHKGRSQCIFSYAKPLAKKFLFSIKETLKTNVLLKTCFCTNDANDPYDVLWDDPEREAPLWALDEGIVLKGHRGQKEPSIGAAGLVEGMPTGLHFDRRVYDDITTYDLCKSPDMIADVKEKFDVSMHLGKDGGTHRVVGTFYDHADALVYVKDKLDPEDEKAERKLYTLRLKPGTDNGLRDGAPVLFSEKYLNKKKLDKSFNTQILCDPTPIGSRKFEPDDLKDVKPADIPKGLYKIVLVDPAGDKKKGKGDAWAMINVGIKPAGDNELGLFELFINDAVIDRFGEDQGPIEAAKLYMRGGLVQKICVEKVGLSTVETHIKNALSANGVRVSVEDETIFILRPAGRKKTWRIENALSHPFRHGKIHVSTAVPVPYRERMRMEMSKYPYWQDDFLDVLSYVYDVIAELLKEGGIPAPGIDQNDSYEASIGAGHSGQTVGAGTWMGN